MYNDYNPSFEDLLKRDNSVLIHHRNIQNVALEMFKVKHNVCPEIKQSFFFPNISRGSSTVDFHRPNVNSVYYGEHSIRSFDNTMVPESIKNISDQNEFKKCIIAWLPDNCLCRLCRDYVPGLRFVTLYE